MTRRRFRTVARRTGRQGGLTLIELIIFIVVVSVGIAGILSVLNLTVGRSADPMVRKQVLAVAEAMMEEILSKDFANPAGGFSPVTTGNPTQAERPSFDDVDDYRMTGGWKWTGVKSINDTATNVTGLENYTVTVSVAGTTDLTGIAAANAKKITVQVSGGSETISLIGYRTNYE